MKKGLMQFAVTFVVSFVLTMLYALIFQRADWNSAGITRAVVIASAIACGASIRHLSRKR